ncbi:unnamed protein product [Rotaria magnacalcarata]|uniref:Uncharacterized protein n=1 Tax=Rotaria magnacalcarata TaxID=392030 RepID=A0A820PJY1_9BILA|nr:unnamed protein product [Rotaria magnacalcarata]
MTLPNNVTNLEVPHKLTVYEHNKLNNKLKSIEQPNTIMTPRLRLKPQMSGAKADKLRQILKTRIPERPIIIDENQGLIGPTSLKVDPVESIISNLSTLSRGLRNRVIKEYLNNTQIAYTLTCPHPSGYYRTVPCNYCSHGNPHVRIEKLTRYFICQFRSYKHQFRYKNLGNKKAFSRTHENTVPPELSVQNDDIEKVEYGTTPIVADDVQASLTVPIKLLGEPTDEALTDNLDDMSAKINVTVKKCTAVGDDHSSCNGEPLEMQYHLHQVTLRGPVNVECPTQDTYQLEDKHIQFCKANVINMGKYWDDDKDTRRFMATDREIGRDYGSKRKEQKNRSIQQNRDLLRQYIDHQIEVDQLLEDDPNVPLPIVKELYNKHYPLNTLTTV